MSRCTLLVAFLSLLLLPQDHPEIGYKDTPMLPGQKWHVHDGDRPEPVSVDPDGRAPGVPADAVVLFDGRNLDAWQGEDGKPAGWKVKDGYFEVSGGGGIRTREEFGDLQLHLEWATPEVVKGDSQGRGNSGVFFMGRYELQVLDSFRNRSYPDGQAAALYGQWPPLVNASRGPGIWQSYDVVFRAPRFAGEELESPAMITVFHNGVCVHHGQTYMGPTRHKSLPRYEAHAPSGPIFLQDHGNPVRYRNVWVRPMKGYDQPR